MLFKSVTLFVVSTLVAFTAASPFPGILGRGGGQCNTEDIQCCNSKTTTDDPSFKDLLTNSDDPSVQGLLGKIGDTLDAAVGVGLGCTQLSAINVGGGSKCTSTPMCCENNQYNALVVVGCTPISVGA